MTGQEPEKYPSDFHSWPLSRPKRFSLNNREFKRSCILLQSYSSSYSIERPNLMTPMPYKHVQKVSTSVTFNAYQTKTNNSPQFDIESSNRFLAVKSSSYAAKAAACPVSWCGSLLTAWTLPGAFWSPPALRRTPKRLI